MAMREYSIGVPTSAVMSCASSSPRSLIAADSWFSSPARSSIEACDQSGNASCAAATAASTSLASPTGTEPIRSSVDGLTTSIEPFPLGRTHEPPM